MISFIWEIAINIRENTSGYPHFGDATMIRIQRKVSFRFFPFCRYHIFDILHKYETKKKGPILLRQSNPLPLCPNFSPKGSFSVSLLKSRRWELVVGFSLQLVPRSSPFVYDSFSLFPLCSCLFSSLHLSFLFANAMAEINMLPFSSFGIKEMGTGYGVLPVAFLGVKIVSLLDLCFFSFLLSSGLDPLFHFRFRFAPFMFVRWMPQEFGPFSLLSDLWKFKCGKGDQH